MEGSDSCVVQDTTSILSTFNPARTTHLEKIVLDGVRIFNWFDDNGPVHVETEREEGEGDGGKDKVKWRAFDATLSKLAKNSISTREKRLTLTLVSRFPHDDAKLMSLAKKWLPNLLPQFNGLGLLHVHGGWDSSCREVDDDYLSRDRPDCLA